MVQIKTLFKLATIIGFPILSMGQGLYQQRHQFELNGMANVPVFSGTFKLDNYYQDGDEMVGRKDFIDYGANFRYKFMSSERVSFGIEGALRRFEVFPHSSFESDFRNTLIGNVNFNSLIQSESIRLRSTAITPFISIAPRYSTQGVGFSHDFGLGYNLTYILEGSYNYAITEDIKGGEVQPSPTDTYWLEADWEPFKSLQIMYSAGVQYPITKHIHYKLGFNYYVNIYWKPKDLELISNQVGWFDYGDTFFNVQRENFFTWNLVSGFIFSL